MPEITLHGFLGKLHKARKAKEPCACSGSAAVMVVVVVVDDDDDDDVVVVVAAAAAADVQPTPTP